MAQDFKILKIKEFDMTQVQNIAEKQKTFVVKLDKKLEKIIESEIPIEEEIIKEQTAEIDKTTEILNEVKDIKALLNIDLEVIKQQAIDTFTLELINNGIL